LNLTALDLALAIDDYRATATWEGKAPEQANRSRSAVGLVAAGSASPTRAGTRWLTISPHSGWADNDPADASSLQRKSGQRRDVQICRILVVDDDEVILAAVSGILGQEGFRVETATNGSEALDCVERSSPDVVLLDMRMPVLDGWAFARVLREREIHLTIVVMTAAQDARVWAEEIGANAYLAKPFDLDDLIAVVERACSSV